MMLIIAFLFLIFGTYVIIKPNGVSPENLKLNYSVSDLIRGWGIYSVTIGYYRNLSKLGIILTITS